MDLGALDGWARERDDGNTKAGGPAGVDLEEEVLWDASESTCVVDPPSGFCPTGSDVLKETFLPAGPLP